jgi:hypothetical protein
MGRHRLCTLLLWADEAASAFLNGGRPMKSDLELQKLIDNVERQEHEAEGEIRHVREAARQLHMANSLPKTMSTDGPTFLSRPGEE